MHANRLLLDAQLAERGPLRFTPAGVSAIDILLRHASRQPEAGAERTVECELAGVVFGDAAQALSRVPLGAMLRCKGFLARRWRTGITVAMHVNEFEQINATEGN